MLVTGIGEPQTRMRGSYLPSSGWMTSDFFQWCPVTGRGAVGKMGAQGVPYEIEKIVV